MGAIPVPRDPTHGSNLEWSMAANCNTNSHAKEVFSLITAITSSLVWANVVVALSVTARVEVS